MTDRRAERNRRKREQNRARYDTPREDRELTPEQRRIQLAANTCGVPVTQVPVFAAEQLWAKRAELLAALDEAGVRGDATAPLRVYVTRFFGINQPPERAEDTAQDLGLGTTTVWNNLQRAYAVMHDWVQAELPLCCARPRAMPRVPTRSSGVK